MPRPKSSRGRLTSTKFSQFFPQNASSPLKEQSLSKKEFEQHLQEHKSEAQNIADEYNANLLEHYNEAFVELEKTMKDILSPKDLDIPVTPEILETYKTLKPIGYKRKYSIAKVTPGPNIDRPISILHRSVPGEMALFMNGSPLVTSYDKISVPQMSIPLLNGRVLTYVGNKAADHEQSICDEIDPEVKEGLNAFYKLLEKKIKKK